MTTIATDGKTIAADSRITGQFIDEHQKLFKVGDSVFGIAGTLTVAMRFIDWVKAGTPPEATPSIDDETAILQLTPAGVWYWDQALRPVQYRRPYAAIGSGADFALGALVAGCTPRQAVAVACELDESSAPPITVMRVPRNKGHK